MREPIQVPPGVSRRLNFADRLDPAGLDANLANCFTPSDKATDHRIKNPYRLDLRAGGPHAASGYLGDQAVRDAVG